MESSSSVNQDCIRYDKVPRCMSRIPLKDHKALKCQWYFEGSCWLNLLSLSSLPTHWHLFKKKNLVPQVRRICVTWELCVNLSQEYLLIHISLLMATIDECRHKLHLLTGIPKLAQPVRAGVGWLNVGNDIWGRNMSSLEGFWLHE